MTKTVLWIRERVGTSAMAVWSVSSALGRQNCQNNSFTGPEPSPVGCGDVIPSETRRQSKRSLSRRESNSGRARTEIRR